MRIRTTTRGPLLLALLAVPALVLPGVASAAPVPLEAAVLAPHEFPAGSDRYEVESEAPELSAYRVDDADRACADATTAVETSLEGARAVEAEAVRGATGFETTLYSQPVATELGAWREACADESQPLTAPADLARLNPVIFRSAPEENGEVDQYGAYVNVRGVTVIIDADATAGAADWNGFWDVLRTQVAKVERQP